MITIEKIPEQELRQLRKKVKNDFTGLFWTIIAFIVGFGLIIGKPAVIALCAGAICIIFLIVKAAGSPISGDTKVTRRNKVTATKLKRTGRKARHTTIHLTMAEDTVPHAYTQTNKFLVYHSFGLSFIDTVTPQNHRLLVGREVEITYMASNGYVIELKILDEADKDR